MWILINFVPHVFHSELAEVVEYFGRPKVKSAAKYMTDKGEFILTDELPKNNLISIALQCILGQDYYVGSLYKYMTDLDMPAGNYSLFGHSRNDSFIMHKDKYRAPCKDGKIVLGTLKGILRAVHHLHDGAHLVIKVGVPCKSRSISKKTGLQYVLQ